MLLYDSASLRHRHRQASLGCDLMQPSSTWNLKCWRSGSALGPQDQVRDTTCMMHPCFFISYKNVLRVRVYGRLIAGTTLNYFGQERTIFT